MKHGDLSNTVGTVLSFNVFDYVLKRSVGFYRVPKLLEKVIPFSKRVTPNAEVISTLSFLYRNTEFTVDLVVVGEEFLRMKDAVESYLQEFPCNRIVFVKNAAALKSRLLTGDISWFIDNNKDFLKEVNSPYAVTYEQFKLRGADFSVSNFDYLGES